MPPAAARRRAGGARQAGQDRRRRRDERVRGARHSAGGRCAGAVVTVVRRADAEASRRRSTRLRGVLGGHDALGNLTPIVDAGAPSTPATGRIRVDPSLARGLSYYTGRDHGDRGRGHRQPRRRRALRQPRRHVPGPRTCRHAGSRSGSSASSSSMTERSMFPRVGRHERRRHRRDIPG